MGKRMNRKEKDVEKKRAEQNHVITFLSRRNIFITQRIFCQFTAVFEEIFQWFSLCYEKVSPYFWFNDNMKYSEDFDESRTDGEDGGAAVRDL